MDAHGGYLEYYSECLEFVWLVFYLDLCSSRASDEPVVLICVVVLPLPRAYSSTAFVLL